jgi:hypothetical protein
MTGNGEGKKARTVSFGAFLAALVAFAAMAALAGYIFYTDSNNLRTLHDSYNQQTQVLLSLNDNYTTLYNSFATLAENYTALLGQYANLQTSYTLLQINYNNMTQIANLQKNQTIVSGSVLHIVKNSFDSVVIQTSYAGYIRVQLSATQPVTIMLTNYKYPITIDYPVSGSQISSGHFTLPVLDGTNYLEIYSPAGSDTTVTLTITLFY